MWCEQENFYSCPSNLRKHVKVSHPEVEQTLLATGVVGIYATDPEAWEGPSIHWDSEGSTEAFVLWVEYCQRIGKSVPSNPLVDVGTRTNKIGRVEDSTDETQNREEGLHEDKVREEMPQDSSEPSRELTELSKVTTLKQSKAEI